MVSLLKIARKFVNEKFVGCDDVLGVLLEGSAAIGVRDKFVDLDFEVIIAEKRYREGANSAYKNKRGILSRH